MFDLDPAVLFFSIVWSFVAFGYISYGRKNELLYFQLAGIALLILTFFVNNVWWLGGGGAALAALPFFMERL